MDLEPVTAPMVMIPENKPKVPYRPEDFMPKRLKFGVGGGPAAPAAPALGVAAPPAQTGSQTVASAAPQRAAQAAPPLLPAQTQFDSEPQSANASLAPPTTIPAAGGQLQMAQAGSTQPAGGPGAPASSGPPMPYQFSAGARKAPPGFDFGMGPLPTTIPAAGGQLQMAQAGSTQPAGGPGAPASSGPPVPYQFSAGAGNAAPGFDFGMGPSMGDVPARPPPWHARYRFSVPARPSRGGASPHGSSDNDLDLGGGSGYGGRYGGARHDSDSDNDNDYLPPKSRMGGGGIFAWQGGPLQQGPSQAGGSRSQAEVSSSTAIVGAIVPQPSWEIMQQEPEQGYEGEAEVNEVDEDEPEVDEVDEGEPEVDRHSPAPSGARRSSRRRGGMPPSAARGPSARRGPKGKPAPKGKQPAEASAPQAAPERSVARPKRETKAEQKKREQAERAAAGASVAPPKETKAAQKARQKAEREAAKLANKAPARMTSRQRALNEAEAMKRLAGSAQPLGQSAKRKEAPVELPVRQIRPRKDTGEDTAGVLDRCHADHTVSLQPRRPAGSPTHCGSLVILPN